MCFGSIGLPFDQLMTRWGARPPCECGLWVPASIEVRDPDDEILARGANVHIERLDDDRVWMNITTPDGRDLHIDFYAMKGRRLGMSVRDEGDTPTHIPAAAPVTHP